MPSKLIAALLGVVVVIVLLGGGGYYMLQKNGSGKTAEKAAPPPKPSFVSMKSFTIHVAGEKNGEFRGIGSFIQIGFQLETTSATAVERFEARKPAVRGNVLSVLLEQPITILNDKDARKAMKASVLQVVNRTLSSADNKDERSGPVQQNLPDPVHFPAGLTTGRSLADR